MFRSKIAAISLFAAVLTCNPALRANEFRFELTSESQLMYRLPWFGIADCEPSNFQCDFDLTGTMVATVVGDTLDFSRTNLRIEGNETVLTPSEQFEIAERAGRWLREQTFARQGTGSRFRADADWLGSVDVQLAGNDLRLLGALDRTPADGVGYIYDVRATAEQEGIYLTQYRIGTPERDDTHPFRILAGESALEVAAIPNGRFDVVVNPADEQIRIRDRDIQLTDHQFSVGGVPQDPETIPSEWQQLAFDRLSAIPAIQLGSLLGTLVQDGIEATAIVADPRNPNSNYETTLRLNHDHRDESLNLRSSAIDTLDSTEYHLNNVPVERIGTFDFDGNRLLDVRDLNVLMSEIAKQDRNYDLNGDGATNFDDLNHWLDETQFIPFGDSNLDGQFTSTDFITVFKRGRYETNGFARWQDGDWNGDLVFDSSDFVTIFRARERGCVFDDVPCGRPVANVPEPSSSVFIGLLLLAGTSRQRAVTVT